MKKDYIEFKWLSEKQSVKRVLIQTAVKTTIQILFVKGFFNSPKADEVFKELLFVERHGDDLEEVNDVIQ